MTYIYQAPTNEAERAKWRDQANKAAEHLKKMQFKDRDGDGQYEAAFVFDDGIVKMYLPVSLIERINEMALADHIFASMLALVSKHKDHRAAGESADAQASGMECGHAAPPAPNGHETVADSSAPAVAAVADRCIRRMPPTFTEQCASQATGGVRLKLFPHERFQKRYGKRPMLELLLHLPVCDECFAQMTPAQVIADGMQAGQWGAASKEAQRRNAGILPIREESEIEHVDWRDPEYTALRAHIAKHHPELFQSAPAAPQPEGAGHGT